MREGKRIGSRDEREGLKKKKGHGNTPQMQQTLVHVNSDLELHGYIPDSCGVPILIFNAPYLGCLRRVS